MHLARQRKFWSFLLPILAFIPFLTSCSKKSDSADGKIVVWHWMSDRQNTFEKLAQKYKEQTGETVVFELYAPSEVFSQKVRAAAQSNTLPDVYGILAQQRDFASFIQSGHVANLTAAMEADDNAWKKTFYERSLVNSIFAPGNTYNVAPGIYGVPIDVMTIQMLYNKDLLAKAGLDPENPPQTWEEFLKAADQLNAKGIAPFVSGWGELWMLECAMSCYAIHIMGENKYYDTLRGKVRYTDPDWIRVLSLFEQIRKHNVLFKGAVTMVNKTAEQTFANERAAFTLNGSWCVNVYSGMNPELKYGAMMFPKIDPKEPIKVWGGAGSSFVVNERSAAKEQTIAFLKWLTAKEQQVLLAEETKNLPSNQNAVSDLSPILKSFNDALHNTTHPSEWPLQERPVVNEALLKGIQSILIGEKNPQQVAESTQKLKDKEIAAQK